MKKQFQSIFGSRGRQMRTCAFTLIELLMVITIIGILAALVVGLLGVAKKRSSEGQIKATMSELVTAIESYKSRFGHYPPDNAANSARPQLFYELVGTYSTNGGSSFQLADDSGNISSADLNTAFGVPGIVNAAPSKSQVRPFLRGLKPKKHALVSGNPPAANPLVELLVAPVPGPGGQQPNPWHYVSSNPINNKNGFDLWVEYDVRGVTVTNGNWNFR
jgi:prepilin-type N-terminal cleavage/methylation domain-containing protein